MADKTTLLKTFNTQFFAFLNDILVIFPENKDIAKGKKSFELLNMASPSMIIKIWHSHVNRLYKEHIDNGDFVVVTNIDKIKFTGKKFTNKRLK